MRGLSFIFHNFLYKVTALLVAVVLWAAAQGFRSVERALDLPIVLEDLPVSLVVVDQSAQEVNLTIAGSRAALRWAERELKRYPISLKGVQPGERKFPVKLEGLKRPRGAEFKSRSPSTVVVEIERVQRKKVTVRADLIGTPPAGYRVAGVTVEPGAVVIEGARSSVRRLREILTDGIDVSRLEATLVEEVPLIFDPPFLRPSEGGSQAVRVEVRIEGPSVAPEP